jgi:hypothetical protein
MYIEKIFVSSRKKCNFSSLSNELILINNEKNLPNEYLLILRINKFPLVDTTYQYPASPKRNDCYQSPAAKTYPV